MRVPTLIAALISVTLCMSGGHARAQQQNPPADDNAQQTAPDAPQPQQQKTAPDAPPPQKKRAAKPAPVAKPAAQKPATHPSNDPNAFPEAASRKAAEAAGNAPDQGGSSSSQPATKSSSSTHSGSDPNAFPEAASRKAAEAAGNAPDQGAPSSSQPAAKSSSSTHSGSDPNAFPEAASRKAAEAAGNAPDQGAPSSSQPAAKSSSSTHSGSDPNAFPEAVSRKAAEAEQKRVPLPPDESSSQGSSLTGGLADHSIDSPGVADPARAKKDTQVGGFYMDQEDYKGAYLRYQDAMKSDPTNVDAIFGAAEAAQRLGKLSEAARNYQMYLEIVPNGSKAKQALKALDALSAKK